ncbi:MAG: transposase, partial [Aestuariibacter sp.]|nr:transposase [Aestuariibacter sp.]
LVINEAHLRRVLIEFLDYYNRRRPHQGLDQQSPIERPEPLTGSCLTYVSPTATW